MDDKEWISVKEKLPEENQLVRVTSIWRYKSLDKVMLVKIEDNLLKGKIDREWRYASGLFASSLDENDEWKIL